EERAVGSSGVGHRHVTQLTQDSCERGELGIAEGFNGGNCGSAGHARMLACGLPTLSHRPGMRGRPGPGIPGAEGWKLPCNGTAGTGAPGGGAGVGTGTGMDGEGAPGWTACAACPPAGGAAAAAFASPASAHFRSGSSAGCCERTASLQARAALSEATSTHPQFPGVAVHSSGQFPRTAKANTP